MSHVISCSLIIINVFINGRLNSAQGLSLFEMPLPNSTRIVFFIFLSHRSGAGGRQDVHPISGLSMRQQMRPREGLGVRKRLPHLRQQLHPQSGDVQVSSRRTNYDVASLLPPTIRQTSTVTASLFNRPAGIIIFSFAKIPFLSSLLGAGSVWLTTGRAST